MHKIDQYLFAHREGKRIFQNEDFPNAIDFASRPGTTEELMCMLIVALERKQVKQVAQGIQQGGGDLRVIDYGQHLLRSAVVENRLCFVSPQRKIRCKYLYGMINSVRRIP